VAFFQGRGLGLLDRAVLDMRKLPSFIPQVTSIFGSEMDTYPAYGHSAPPTLAHHVSGAKAVLPVEIPHVHVPIRIPVPRSSSMPKCVGRVDRHVFAVAVNCRLEKHRAVLDQGVVDLAARAGERVEGDEVNGGSYSYDDARHFNC